MPWTHTYISPQSERRLCCASREKPQWQAQYIDDGTANNTEYNPQTLEEHWNSEHMKDVRKRMLAGETLSECQVCNDQILNIHTYRKYFTETLFPHLAEDAYATTDETGYTTMKPISYDYRISNLCNFKCRMCGEQLSSKWEAEKRKLGQWDPQHDPWMIPENKQKIETFQQEVVVKELYEAVENGTIEEIYWVGGEPLMWWVHWDIMEKLYKSGQAKDVTVRYNTNLSKIDRSGGKDYDLYHILAHFKNVNICASIDATGAIGEFIRTGLHWDKWLENFKKGLWLNRVYGSDALVLDVTLTTPGMFDMKAMFDLATNLDVKTYMKITFAFDPMVLMSPMAMPRDVLDEILDELIEYCGELETWKTAIFRETFEDMKSRPTFAEQWPDTYKEGFIKGKQRLNLMSINRRENFRMENILTGKALEWWSANENEV